MTNAKPGDRRTCAPVYDPAIAAPVLRLPAISHEEALAILADRSVEWEQADFAQRANRPYCPSAGRKGMEE
jgi:hypothetical protein